MVYHYSMEFSNELSGGLLLNDLYRKLLSYPRLRTLFALKYYSRDGMIYEQLKNFVALPEGTLATILSELRDEELIRKDEVGKEGKRATAYYISTKGIEACKMLSEWFKKLTTE